MKKLLIMLLCMVLLLSVCVTTVSALGYVNSTENVSDWAKDEVRKAVVSDLVDNTWLWDEGQTLITREEFCIFLTQLAYAMNDYEGFENESEWYGTAAEKFQDVEHSGYIDEALNLELVNGVSETRFEPERAVTREEAAVMLHRLFKKFGYETAKADLSKYADGELVSDWAKESVEALWGCEPFVSALNNDEIIPQGTISREQIIVMRWRFHEEKHGKQDILFHEDSEPEILVELELVSTDDFAKGGTITVEEVLEIASKMIHKASDAPIDYSKWYTIDDLAELDGLEEDRKRLLMELYDEKLNPLFHYSDFHKIDFDKDITYGEAYTYMLRCVEDESDLVGYDMITDIDEVYSLAFDIGLIDDADTHNANNPIPRQEFYKLLHRVVFCEYDVVWGFNYGSQRVERYVDLRREQLEKEKNAKTYTIEVENIELKTDMTSGVELFQLSWDFPKMLMEKSPSWDEEHPEYAYYGYEMEYVFKDKNGNELFSGYEGIGINKIKKMKKYLFGKYPSVPVVLCGKYVNLLSGDEYLFEIDLSNIEIVEEGEVLIPDALLKSARNDEVSKISLKDGAFFEKDAWYMLTIHGQNYRKEEYNTVGTVIFCPDETANLVDLEYYYEEPWWAEDNDTYIRKITVEGDFDNGIKITLTPESTEKFNVDFYRPW